MQAAPITHDHLPRLQVITNCRPLLDLRFVIGGVPVHHKTMCVVSCLCFSDAYKIIKRLRHVKRICFCDVPGPSPS